jgi:TM2 domain-containing membrane protein YozV
MQTQVQTCPTCQTQNYQGGRCTNCGTVLPISPMPMQHMPNYGEKPIGSEKKIVAGICGILLGGLGIHKFILGYTTEGVIMLLVSLLGGFLTCGISSAVISVIGIVEGIMYLTKSDEEFSSTYILNKKGWF